MNTPAPRVSVIIPAYNSERFISEAIASVFTQTYSDYEVIVADDGSTDTTKAALKKFGNKIRVLDLPHRGVCAARNLAIAKSSGEFIALLDSDDIWEPEKLELQTAFMDAHPEYGLSYSYSTNFTDASEGNISLVKKVDFEGFIFADLFTKTSFANSTIVMRRSAFDAVGGYDESLIAMEDYDLNLRISQKYQIGRIPKSLLRRRIHPGSFYSSGYDNQYVYQLPVYDKYMSDKDVEELVGTTKQEYMGNFILKFIFKNLFDGREEFIAQKLSDLERYSPEKASVARALVANHTLDHSTWRPLITEFDTWYDDVKHKSALYKNRMT